MFLALMLVAAVMSPIAAASPAQPASVAASTAKTNEVAKAAAGSLMCKRSEETGSRVGAHKVCMTRAQWNEQEASGRAFVDAMHAQARATQ